MLGFNNGIMQIIDLIHAVEQDSLIGAFAYIKRNEFK